jgi:hypothetical protein
MRTWELERDVEGHKWIQSDVEYLEWMLDKLYKLMEKNNLERFQMMLPLYCVIKVEMPELNWNDEIYV